MKKKNKQFIT